MSETKISVTFGIRFGQVRAAESTVSSDMDSSEVEALAASIVNTYGESEATVTAFMETKGWKESTLDRRRNISGVVVTYKRTAQ